MDTEIMLNEIFMTVPDHRGYRSLHIRTFRPSDNRLADLYLRRRGLCGHERVRLLSGA